MSVPVAAWQPSRMLRAEAPERSIQRRIKFIWGLLFLNTMTFFPWTWSGLPLVVPIPATVGKLITQGALLLAFMLALTVNRRVIVRPSVFLSMLSLLVLGALISSVQPHMLGSIYRTFRLAGFVATLWLLSPWWGRRDLLLVRAHLTASLVILGTVLAGLLVSPGRALAAGRLSGVLWSVAPTQVGHLAGVATGLVSVLWLCGVARGRVALSIVAVTVPNLLLAHTRTALVAVVAGVLVASLSLFREKARVRKLFLAASVLASIGVMTLAGVVEAWWARGQDTQQLSELSGRIPIWDSVVNLPRNKFQVLFGFGLSDESINGHGIDSSWLGAYYDLGLFAVTICAMMLLFLVVSAYFQPLGTQRALGLFLVTFCLVSSFAETGLSQASAYLLDLTLGASLLVSSAQKKSLDESSAGSQPISLHFPKRGGRSRRPGR